MGVEHRPYVGTWQLNQKKLVQHTPDGLVFLNGDTSLPGCAKCNGRIDIQKYITQVSVDSGTDPSAASANFTLSVPSHSRDNMHNDAQFLIRPGLEVHVYMRGYFPVQGQYAGISPEETGGIDVTRMISYPYYHVFHGVVTSASHSYNQGFQDISVNCSSMLHFWQYHNMSTNASYFGAKPVNSGLRQSLVGHNFTGMTPFSIIYTLFHDTAGAAGGVAFALDDKSNVDAKSPLLNRSLYSLNIEYWRERFKTRMMNLRMHGASGRVFSTAQAAFLGRLSGDQVKKLLNDQWKIKTGANSTKKFDILSAARSLNLIREVRDPSTGESTVQGLDVVEAERDRDPDGVSEETPGYEVNIAAMQAFTTDIGNFGSVNLFESTYETKLDVANKVLEITGWEFYQDVDGDFVFKPPMYNLDTRSNRVYRIEDIDIISLNISEKEPEATYVTVNGSQFTNLKGTGTEGEWGVRGQYIDYRMVAQFGWRPSSFETAYFDNPRAMFFAAVNRLDILNIGINSANVTIPLRPELRPGYPVYIECLDAFYYLQGFNHSLAYGSQCTTSLTLVGKRAKFYAPGDPLGTGIDAIDLGNTSLPQRPLEVLGDDGVPRLAGFPNVVLALDPDAINPLFSLAGLDLVDINNPRVLRSVLRIAEQYHLVSLDPNTGRYIIRVDDEESMQLLPIDDTTPSQRSRLANDGTYRVSLSFEDLVSVSGRYAKLGTEPGKRIESNNEIIAQKQQAIRTKKIAIQEKGGVSSSLPGDASSDIARYESEIAKLEKEVERLKESNRSEQKRLEEALLGDRDVLLLTNLVKEIGDRYLSATSDFKNPSRTAALLDLLSDKKAIFTNGQQPGSYRYYSSSHPDPAHQGQRSLLMSPGEGGRGGAGVALEGSRRARGFVSHPRRPGTDGRLPEAEIGDVSVLNGLRIVGASGEEVVTTDRIQTITFAKHDAAVDSNPTVYDYTAHFSGLDASHRDVIAERFKAVVYRYEDDDTIDDLFRPGWEEMTVPWNGPSFPTTVNLGHGDIPTTSLVLSAWPDDLGDPARSVGIIRDWFIDNLFIQTYKTFEDRWKVVSGITDTNLRAEEEAKFFRDVQLATFGSSPPRLGRKKKRKKRKSEFFYSPVFPVSDENGYQVVGTYRYGRGLLVQAGSSFEQLTLADPLQFADPSAVEKFVDVLQGKKPYLSGDTTDDGERSGVQVRTTDIRTRATEQVIESITTNPATPSEVVEQLSSVFLQTDVGLNNWIARSVEGVDRVPVGNAAYNLSDLQVHVNQNSCSCRGAQADILIAAYHTENFVEVVSPDLDSIAAYASSQAYERGMDWHRSKDALRGKVLERGSEDLADAFRNSAESWRTLGSQTRAGIDNVLRQSREAASRLPSGSGEASLPFRDEKSRNDVLTEIESQETPDRNQ